MNDRFMRVHPNFDEWVVDWKQRNDCSKKRLTQILPKYKDIIEKMIDDNEFERNIRRFMR